jgi:hypothetical protein
MNIIINDHRKIFAIQKEFNEAYPFLKIEFFSKPHRSGGASSKKIMKQPGKTIGECRILHNKGALTIMPEMTVAELEQNINDVYGLSVQIFRKSGNAWLETTRTDNWTLQEQNNQGKELSNRGETYHQVVGENEAAE